MSNNKSIFGSTYYSHVKPYNRHMFTTTGVCAIRPSINLPLGRLTPAWIYTHKHPTSLMNNLHKRGHFGDILFQLTHLEWWTTLFNHKRYTTKYLNLSWFILFYFILFIYLFFIIKKLQISPWFCTITKKPLKVQ